ncbi:hypothetical protein HDE_07862 [Halotydeus destructor]|nr:hypothetical protein HDE_07862 [Halotydeus destructor]
MPSISVTSDEEYQPALVEAGTKLVLAAYVSFSNRPKGAGFELLSDRYKDKAIPLMVDADLRWTTVVSVSCPKTLVYVFILNKTQIDKIEKVRLPALEKKLIWQLEPSLSGMEYTKASEEEKHREIVRRLALNQNASGEPLNKPTRSTYLTQKKKLEQISEVRRIG